MHLRLCRKSNRLNLFLTFSVFLCPIVSSVPIETQPNTTDSVDETDTTTTEISLDESESHSHQTKVNALSDLGTSVFNDICTLELNQLPPESPLAQKVQLLCRLRPFDNTTKPTSTQPPPPIDTQTRDTSASETTTERHIKKDVKDADQDDDYFLPKGYDKQVPPRLNESVTLPNGAVLKIDKHVSVRVYIFIRSVSDVDEVNEKVVLDMDLYLFWFDGKIRNHLRSQGRNVSLKPLPLEPTLVTLRKGLSEKIWVPDIYFEEVDLVNRPKVLDEGGQVIWLYPDYGGPFLRLRMRTTLQCDMDFSYYPVDTQKCEFHLRSSQYNSDEVHLLWSSRLAHGVYLKEISNPNFDFQVTGVEEYDDHVDLGPETPKVRKSSFLKFELWIRRKMSYHLIQTYLPSVFFIVVTWLAYLVPARMVEVRLGITMTTLLTMTSMFSSIRENTPIVGYVKAIDIWMVNCVFFIFLTLVALSVGACFRRAKKRVQRNKEELDEAGHHQKKAKYSFLQRFLENHVAFFLVALFAALATLYWSWLLERSNYLNWTVNSTYNRLTVSQDLAGPSSEKNFFAGPDEIVTG